MPHQRDYPHYLPMNPATHNMVLGGLHARQRSFASSSFHAANHQCWSKTPSSVPLPLLTGFRALQCLQLNCSCCPLISSYWNMSEIRYPRWPCMLHVTLCTTVHMEADSRVWHISSWYNCLILLTPVQHNRQYFWSHLVWKSPQFSQ